MLAFASHEAARTGHHVTLRGCGPAVRRMLHLSRLMRFVELERGRRLSAVRRCAEPHTQNGYQRVAPGPTLRSMSEKDRPWVMRTYAGHSTAAASNALYRTNLAKGQTGLSVAFDLPTQTGYDPDDALSRGEVGKVGVPVPHLGEMRRLFDDIPLTEMNTSMTINATAMWLLALYQVVAEEQNPELEPTEVAHQLAGTTQNDIIKEYLSRGTYVFPPEHSLRLIADIIAYTVHEIPKWNPINICSYHLQEAGATPTQELAYALCTAIAVLDAVKDSGQVSEEDFGKVVGRISFFVNAGVRFVEETCKMRAFVELWDEITRERYGVTDDEDAPVPVRRPGQLARADRGAAGEQRAADRARDARRHAVARTPAPAPSSCRRGTRRSACPGRGTSSGRCGCSRCWPSSPTCSSTTTSSTARTSSRPRSPSWSRARAPRWTGCRRWAARSRPSSPAT